MAGAQRFHPGFLGGEPAGKMNCGNTPRSAVRDFGLGEHAAQEAFAVALDDVGDPIDVRRVEADADDGRHESSAY